MKELCCLLDTPGLRVSYDATNGWLYNQWLGEHNSSSLKQGAEAVCACLSKQPCTKILSDHSLLVGNWQAASAWIGQHTFAHLATQGLLYVAWVYSPIHADRVAMERSLFFVKKPQVVIFDEMLAAYNWLLSCPAGPN